MSDDDLNDAASQIERAVNMVPKSTAADLLAEVRRLRGDGATPSRAFGRAVHALHSQDDPPTPDRLRAAGFRKTQHLFVYGNGPLRLQWYEAGDEWDFHGNGQDHYLSLPVPPTMSAVRAWVRAVDAANGKSDVDGG